MPSAEIDEFAKILVERVRDAAIQSCDRILQSAGGTGIMKRWWDARKSTPDAFAKMLIPDIVDETVAYLLIAIDQELLRLSFTASSRKSVDLGTVATDFGKLSGYYDGWRMKYSKERFVDDVADLRDFFNKAHDGNK